MKAVDNAGNEAETESITNATEDFTGTISIALSTANWTDQDITVTVTWPSTIPGGVEKQISTNGGTNWSTYIDPVPVGANCTVKARLYDGVDGNTITATQDINKIDKLATNAFTPSASD